ncbi:MAG: sugar transferase [Coriobacteriales bacterium]
MYEDCVKRAFDIAISLAAMPIVGAACLICVPLIKLEDNGPAFYNAPRVGKDGKVFTMYKFRSMYVNAPDLKMPDGSTYNGPDDPRMTKVGAVLRRTSIDELPQFFNVLQGDMSVIGPRPDLIEEAALYEGEESLKLKVKPGITGYAQVYGRNSIPWKQRLALDVWYVKNISFGLDCKIFFKTISAIFTQEGVFVRQDEAEPSSNLEEFGNATK